MQLKRGNHQQPKKNSQVAEYEIKTYMSSTNRKNSPHLSQNQFSKRSPIRRERQQNDSQGEMAYFEPTDQTQRRSINGIQESYNIRSPIRMAGSNTINTNSNNQQNDYGERIDISRPNPFSQQNQISIGTDSRRDKLSRSPKTINIGESAKEVEYNMKSLNKGRSPVYSNSGQDNPVIERTYNMISNEAGNIFLDQPIHQTSFVNQQEVIDTPMGIGRGSFESKDSRDFGQNMAPRDFHEPLPGILGKMSPKANVEGDSDSNSEKNDNHEIKDLRTQLEKKQNVQLRSDDGMVEGAKPIQNDIDKIEDLVKNNEARENITEEEVKKLVRLYVKSYDPRSEGEGRLITNSQTVVPSIKDDLFNDRYKVLQKMNKLSNILLSKNRSQTVYEINSLNRSNMNDERRSFDKNTLNSTVVGSKKGMTYRGKHNKFLFVSLAMLSAKGPNAEDRTILRRMRLDKGGVVDLAQENSKKKNKFKIKKVKASGRGQNMINPKYKEKAAKIVQGWWRDQKAKYKNILNQIVKIQSAWRGKFTRKYVYDIIYLSYLHQRFFDIMERTLVNHTRPMVWDELFSRTKLAKATIKKLLERNDTKYTLIRLKPYFHKWKIIATFLKNRILKSRTLVIKKGDEEQKRVILKKYVDKWSLKANLAKYIGKTKDAEEKRQKFFGALDMFNGLKLHTKKVAFQNSNQPIKNYLQELLKKKLMKKIINNVGTNFLKIKLRASLAKWKDINHYGRIQDMKADAFTKNITHASSRMDRIKLKYYLDKWRRHVPSGKKILDINDGAQLLQKFTLRNLIMDPLQALAEKCDEKNERNKTLSLFNIKRRKIRDNLREFFDRWKNRAVRLEDKDQRNDIYTTLLKNLINNIDRRILYKRFNQWRQRPKIDINNEMNKVREFSEMLTDLFKNNIRSEKYDFLDRLEVTRADRAIQKVTKKIFKSYKKKDRRLLRHFFYKWRGQTKNSEITELQNQLMKYLFISHENRTNRSNLAKYMTRWRLFVSDKKNYDNMEKLKKVYKGGDILGNIKNRRGRDFIIRLYRLMNKDYRPIILDKLSNKLMQPRSSLREIFDRWRRVNEVGKAVETISTIKGKFLHQGFQHIEERSNRDDLMKAFFRWKIMSRKPDEYYPKITRGVDLLNKYFRNNLCEEPFDLIFFARNYDRPLKKLLKNYSNQENRLLNGKLRNLFGRWRKLVGDSNINDLKTNIIVKTKNNLENTLKAKTLAKYFTRWKLYRRKGLDVNFSKGIEILTNLYKRPFKEDVLYAYYEKINQVCQLKGANNLVKATNRYSKTLLRDAFSQFYKGCMNIDPNRMKKIKTRLRRIIKHNEIEPRAKAFHRWANQIKLMQFRDKDMEKARKMIGNTLRNNDKMNLNYAMSRWKKKIQQIREQYLKSLLVKQIKSSQIVKEKMNNQAKLRAALLKWRAKLAPVNYLDRLRHIRKGCKLFKRGLKKRDERFIFDNISELAKQNRKTFLLGEIVNVIKPNIDNYKLQNAMDIWRGKLADTQKMKNKMNTLLDDYLYSDKIHEGLIRNPASELLEFMKNHHQTKMEGASKINKFVQGILNNKNNLLKLKATLKLRELMDKKNKDIDYIKRMQFRRLHRNAQKLKNNDNAKRLQRFIKIKLRRYFDKKKLIQKGANIFSDYIKKRCFDAIANTAKDNQMQKVLIKAINDQESINHKTLSDAFTKWKTIVPVLKQNEAATKLQNLFRAFKSRQKLYNLEDRLDKLAIIHQKYEAKNEKILASNLREWLHRAIMIKNNQDALRIQRFIRRKVRLQKIELAKEKLKNLFINDTKHKLAHVMERSSRIIGGKGEVAYKAVQDILYRNPYNNLIEKLKFLSKVNTLKKVQPKIHDCLKRYYLPLAMKKWKENTYDQTVKCTEAIQKFLRDRYEKKLARDKVKRELLLKKMVLKLQKNNLYKLQLPFSIWHKKVILAEANENATKIQTAIRAYLGKKRGDEMLAKNRLYELFRTNQLKNILDKIKEAGNKKILTNNRKTILTLIMKRKAYTDDKSALKRYFDKWYQYNEYLHDCATKIQNAYRILKANQEKNRLRKIKNILTKSILKHHKVDNDQMRSKLRKWKNKTKYIKFYYGSRKIQRFIRPKLAKMLNDKIKTFFVGNAQKKTTKLLLLAAKFNLLQKALDRPSLQRFSNNLKLITLMDTQDELLRNITRNKENRYNELLLQKYLQRWKEQNEKINSKRNLSAIMIQCAFRSAMARQNAYKQFTINRILTNALIRKEKITNNKIYSKFKKWKNIAGNLTLNRHAMFIQDFCRDILDRLNEQKELSKKIKVNTGIDQIFRIKYGVRYAFQKIKNKRNEETFIRFNKYLIRNRANKLKDCLDRIKKVAFDNKLLSILTIPDAFHARILKKKISIWKENSDKLTHKQGAEIIQRNFRLFLLRKKQENKKIILKDLLLKLAEKHSNILGTAFNRWNNTIQKINEKNVKIKFAKFIANKFKVSEARKKWIKLTKKYLVNRRNDDLFSVVDGLKQFVAINKMKDPFIHKARVSVIQIFKERQKKNRIVTKLKKMLPERNDKNGHDTIVKYFKRWKLSAEKYRERLRKMQKALETIEKRDLVQKTNQVNAACLIKKLFDDLPKYRALDFFNKLKNNLEEKQRFDKLKNAMKQTKDDLLMQNKLKAMDAIYKIFAYRKLNNMVNTLDKNLHKKTKPIFGKELLKKLYNNLRKKSQYNYGDRLQSTNKAKITRINFKNKSKQNKPIDILEDPYAPLKKCLPLFIRFIDNRLKESKQDTLDILKQNDREKYFGILLKKYSDKRMKSPKKDVVEVMRRDALYSQTRPEAQVKLFSLFRKKYIKELTYYLDEPAKLYKLYYLINVTIMHKRISQQRFYRELIRKWRFNVFARKMATKKMEIMYKNLHSSYLQMADEFFGDDGINPSVIQEFEMFGNNVGMFTGEQPQVSENQNKKFTSGVVKNYIFPKGHNPNDIRSSFSKREIIEEREEREEVEEKKINYRGSVKDPFSRYKKK